MTNETVSAVIAVPDGGMPSAPNQSIKWGKGVRRSTIFAKNVFNFKLANNYKTFFVKLLLITQHNK
jgi:hypothetical protein